MDEKENGYIIKKDIFQLTQSYQTRLFSTYMKQSANFVIKCACNIISRTLFLSKFVNFHDILDNMKLNFHILQKSRTIMYILYDLYELHRKMAFIGLPETIVSRLLDYGYKIKYFCIGQ